MSQVDVLSRVFRKDEDMVSRRIADEVILVPVRRHLGDMECIYALNEVAAHIWDLIDGKRSITTLRNLIMQEFEVSETQAQEDLAALIDQLEEIGAIRKLTQT